jgi:RNA polymerase sigma-70 factor (ECF subfamily)
MGLASDVDDHALVNGMLAGHQDAFEEFFDMYYPRLFRFALRRVNHEHAAEDIVQATLIAAVRGLRTWRGDAALFTWLCTLCRREVMAFIRRTGRDGTVRAIDDDPFLRGQLESLASTLDDPERRLERQDLATLVHLTLDYLPERYGDLLEWKYVEGLTVAEIAARLKSTPKSIESMLTRARQAFRDGFTNLVRSRA